MSVSGIGAVQLVEVDVVGPQPPKRVLDGGDDPAPRGPLVVRALPDRAAELGGEHDVVPAALQRLADHLLGVAVGVGGVDDVDARVDRLVDDPGRVPGVVAHGRREHQRAEGVGADLDAGPAEGAVLHGSLPFVVGTAGMPYRKRNVFPELYGRPFRLRKPR